MRLEQLEEVKFHNLTLRALTSKSSSRLYLNSKSCRLFRISKSPTNCHIPNFNTLSDLSGQYQPQSCPFQTFISNFPSSSSSPRTQRTPRSIQKTTNRQEFSKLFWEYRRTCINYDRSIDFIKLYTQIRKKGSRGIAKFYDQLSNFLVKHEIIQKKVFNALSLNPSKELSASLLRNALNLAESKADLFLGSKFLTRFFGFQNNSLPLRQFQLTVRLLLRKVKREGVRRRLQELLVEQVREATDSRKNISLEGWNELLNSQRINYKDLLSLIFDEF